MSHFPHRNFASIVKLIPFLSIALISAPYVTKTFPTLSNFPVLAVLYKMSITNLPILMESVLNHPQHLSSLFHFYKAFLSLSYVLEQLKVMENIEISACVVKRCRSFFIFRLVMLSTTSKQRFYCTDVPIVAC